MGLVILGVPIDCLAAQAPDSPPFGTERAPEALRRLGVVERLGARDDGDLPVRLVGPEPDPDLGLVGGRTVATTTLAIRQAVAALVSAGDVPVLLGGCCTLVPGAVAGLRDAAVQVGLVYVDGQLDLDDELTSPTKEAADLPCALVLGRGPAYWLDTLGTAPLLDPDGLVIVGYQDLAEAKARRSLVPDEVPGLWAPDVDAVRADPAGVGGAAGRAARGDGREVWLHVDVDVLDITAFPATDYAMPNGLRVAELLDVVRAVVGSVDIAGVSLGCYGPDLDREDRCGYIAVDILAAAAGRL
jgi:arginase